jgi:hypothetical protein
MPRFGRERRIFADRRYPRSPPAGGSGGALGGGACNRHPGTASGGKVDPSRRACPLSRVEVVDLDDPATHAAVQADPGAFASGPAPVCIDEYQHVPAVLQAIK